jgi:hypothetical protein
MIQAYRSKRLLASMLLIACAMTAAAQEHGDHPADGRASEPEAPASPLVVAIDATTLAGLERESVTATAHEKKLHCEGVPLAALLRASKAMPAEPLRGARLASYVLVTARDGYRAVYSLAELDPTLGNRKVLLVDRCDGKPLDEDDGPLRLIAPEDARPARWVRQVQSIAVVAAP